TTRPVRSMGRVKSRTSAAVRPSAALARSSYATTAEKKVAGSRGKKAARNCARPDSERAASIYTVVSRRYFTGTACGSDLRSEEHTSELQSHHDLVCRL